MTMTNIDKPSGSNTVVPGKLVAMLAGDFN